MTEDEECRYTTGRILFGILLSIAFCFLAVSTATYSHSDPYGATIYASDVPIHNACGRPGAYCSAFLIRFCGIGVCFLLAAFFFRLLSYWGRSPLRSPVLKVLGSFLILTAISGAASTFLPLNAFHSKDAPRQESSSEAAVHRFDDIGTELGPGGELGAAARYILDKKLRFAPAGIGIFFLFMFTAGVILAGKSRFLDTVLRVTGILTVAELFLVLFKRKEPLPAEVSAEPPVSEVSAEEQVSADSPDDAEEETEDEETIAPADTEELPEDAEEEFSSDEEPAQEYAEDSEADAEQEEPEKPYQIPSITILPRANPVERADYDALAKMEGERLQKAFEDYNCAVKVVGYQSGPVITLFELELSKGLKIAQIQSLTNDLAIAMKVPSVRIVAPIPGKNSVGVEIPNKDRQFVRLREVMEESAARTAKMEIPLYLGKDVTGDPIVSDLSKLPHLLIAGRTGTGKSVCLNSIILSILMTKKPSEVRMVLIDPKMVELSPYKQIPHLFCPVITDMKKAGGILNWLCEKMDERYNLLARVGVRQLKEYNRLTPERLRQRYQPESEEEWVRVPKSIPAIVVIADEMADMMAIAGKDIQEYIARLAAKSRAVGIYLILATQKPTVDVVTGLIKSNLPARIAFGVATQSDSRVILDINGAEKLLGNGDLLFLDSVTNQIIRGQGTYIDDEEIYSVNCEISVDTPSYMVNLDDEIVNPVRTIRNDDPLYEKAVEMVVSERRGSTSLLQRRFSIGYGRAAKIIDAMEADGIIGPKTENDSKPRKVLITAEQWEAMRSGLDVPEPGKPSIPPGFLPTPAYYPPESRPVPVSKPDPELTGRITRADFEQETVPSAEPDSGTYEEEPEEEAREYEEDECQSSEEAEEYGEDEYESSEEEEEYGEDEYETSEEEEGEYGEDGYESSEEEEEEYGEDGYETSEEEEEEYEEDGYESSEEEEPDGYEEETAGDAPEEETPDFEEVTDEPSAEEIPAFKEEPETDHSIPNLRELAKQRKLRKAAEEQEGETDKDAEEEKEPDSGE